MGQQIQKRDALVFFGDLREDFLELIDKDDGTLILAVAQLDSANSCNASWLSK